MRVELQSAYILHTRNYRDSSLIIECLTPDYGRVSAVVKGVRSGGKAAKQKRGLVQAFIPLLLSWSGNTDLKTITHVEAGSKQWNLAGKRLFSALYVNELLMRLVHRYDENPDVFCLYEWVLQGLQNDRLIDVALRRFELKLLDLLGYGLPLATMEHDTEQSFSKERYYQFDGEHMFMPIESGDINNAAVNVFKGEELIAIGQGDFNDSIRPVAKRLCRLALKSHLGEKPLKTRELFN